MRKDGFMKRKTIVTAAVSVMAAAIMANLDYAQAAAQNSIRSHGNLAFADGSSMVIYSSDIHYLQGEIEDLFAELPSDYVNNDSLTEE